MFIISGCMVPRLSGTIQVDSKLMNPIIVDFVFVYDNAVLEELKKVPSMQWFSKREQYKMDLEINNKIEILSYELVPGQKINIRRYKPKQKNEGLIVYASYVTAGDHRVILKDYNYVTLELMKDDFLAKISN
jgi:hypothetical protein